MALPKKYRIRKKQAPSASFLKMPGKPAPTPSFGGIRKKLAAPKPRKKYVFRPR